MTSNKETEWTMESLLKLSVEQLEELIQESIKDNLEALRDIFKEE